MPPKPPHMAPSVEEPKILSIVADTPGARGSARPAVWVFAATRSLKATFIRVTIHDTVDIIRRDGPRCDPFRHVRLTITGFKRAGRQDQTIFTCIDSASRPSILALPANLTHLGNSWSLAQHIILCTQPPTAFTWGAEREVLHTKPPQSPPALAAQESRPADFPTHPITYPPLALPPAATLPAKRPVRERQVRRPAPTNSQHNFCPHRTFAGFSRHPGNHGARG